MDTIDYSNATTAGWFMVGYGILVLYGLVDKSVKLRLPAALVEIYNVVQVIWNVGIIGLIVASLYESYHGRGVIYFYGSPASTWQENAYLATAVYVYYLNKFADLIDTLIIVLHGKTEQLSFLHVSHHISIVWCMWAGVYVFNPPDAFLSVLINALIHVIMYSYYFLAARKVRMPVIVKKSITTLQQLQFVLLSIQSAFGLRYYPSSSWQYTSAAVTLFEVTALFILFSLWRQRAYADKGASGKAKKQS